MLAVTCGGAAIAGHLFPVTLRLKGGKGVATGAGVLFALNWMAGAAAVLVWLIVFLAFRYVSLASIAGALPLPFAHHFTADHLPRRWETPWPITVFLALVTIIVVARHRENIARLRRGEEKKISFSKATGHG
ncbi:MAG: glycerol-3-phosphate acyltransferase [Planctomycetes bacterium]|nr:glycerol-3-phosphate acyltransferase [Planctomycetota bacterium]